MDIATLPKKEIEEVLNMIEEHHIFPHLEIKWGTLSLVQFEAAIPLQKYANTIKLDDLDKEKITFLFDQDKGKINDFFYR